MKEAKKQVVYGIAIFLAVVIYITICPNVAIAAEKREDIPLPIYCYTISTGRIETYKSINGAYSGYISGSVDKVTILEIYIENGEYWCWVEYPKDSGGSKTAYVQASQLFSNVDFLTETIRIGKKKTTYRKSNLKQSFGSVYADDDVIVVGTSGNKTQIIYPISGGYKMAWISGTYKGSGQVANVSDAYYQIKTALNGSSVLDIYGAYTSDGTNLQLYQNGHGTNQGFLIKKEVDGYYSIIPLHARDKRLDVEGNGITSGTNIIQWTANNGDNQRWKIIKTSDGYYSFISKCNGLYIDVSGAETANGTNIQCWEGNGTKAQKFILEEVVIGGKRYCETEEGKATTSNSSANNVANKLQLLISQYQGTRWNDYFYGIQCKGFANLIFYDLFGVYIGAYDNQTKYYIPNVNGAVEVGRLSSSAMTVNKAKAILQQGQPGDYIQVKRRNKTYGHSMILVGSDDKGITVFDCNSDGKNTVKTYHITWDSFYKSNSAMSMYHAINY